MKRWISYLALLATGVGVGASGEFLRERSGQSVTEQKWRVFLRDHEDDSHDRIMGFQQALLIPSAPASGDSVEALSRSLEAQLKIEELIIRSREADHAEFTVYGSLITTLIAAAVGALTSLIVATRRAQSGSTR
jgi:hypothetical protein